MGFNKTLAICQHNQPRKIIDAWLYTKWSLRSKGLKCLTGAVSGIEFIIRNGIGPSMVTGLRPGLDSFGLKQL